MENVEDSEEEGGTGTYSQLAAAMEADGHPTTDSSDQEQDSGGEYPSGADSGAESASDVENSNGVSLESDAGGTEKI